MSDTTERTHNPTILTAHTRCSINNHCYEAQNTVIWEREDESRIVTTNSNNCEGLTVILEKEMATHASVLAWRIPGMGEPGGLPSMGSHRVGHD